MKRFQFKYLHGYGSKITRRAALFSIGALVCLSTGLVSCGDKPQTSNNNSATSASTAGTSGQNNGFKAKEIRIVRSKQLTSLAILESQGNLEKALQPLGVTVKWAEFAAGPQQLEAINANGLDIASTAAHPPVFSQAAGNQLVYLATTPINGGSISLLVPKGSTVQNISELKGKKIAFQKASIGHYLVYKGLQQAGLKLDDVESVFLPPPDAATAFAQAKVDGWYIWEPFVTRAEVSGAGRVLESGEKYADTRNFYSTSRKFYEDNPELIRIFFTELQKSEEWLKTHPKEAAQILAPITKLEPNILEKMHAKLTFGVRGIDEDVIKKQEELAQLWFDLKQIPNVPKVREGFLKPEEYAKILPPEVLNTKN
ncbi:aliphatic sulfonate ABC transporter substrate-binding protein [Alkalinema pantanalense CENA528]|uniref:aliphatic sulfonate ABC transporter substrate-binding protein n=1 Tax=Alkalinema pantanalense TaxID=1620705 RepID=UPI003D6ECDC4